MAQLDNNTQVDFQEAVYDKDTKLMHFTFYVHNGVTPTQQLGQLLATALLNYIKQTQVVSQ